MDDLQACRERARDAGVPDHITEWWLGHARPRVLLDEIADDHPASGTKFAGYIGGSPLLPESIDWWGLPHFVAAIDCGALPKMADLPLPETGQLLFFGNKGEIEFHPAAWDTGGRVLYVPAGTPTAERALPDDVLEDFERQPFPIGRRLALHHSFHWSFPNWESVTDASVGDVYDIYEQCNLNDLTYDLHVTGAFALGGYSSIVHTDPCNEVREVCGDEDWRLLAEARNYFTDSYSFGGYVYWVIRRQDLIEQRFDRVKTLMQGIG